MFLHRTRRITSLIVLSKEKKRKEKVLIIVFQKKILNSNFCWMSESLQVINYESLSACVIWLILMAISIYLIS